MFAVSFPGVDALKTIYHSILQGHISVNNLPSAVGKISEKLVDCALAMNQKVCTAVKYNTIITPNTVNIFQWFSLYTVAIIVIW